MIVQHHFNLRTENYGNSGFTQTEAAGTCCTEWVHKRATFFCKMQVQNVQKKFLRIWVWTSTRRKVGFGVRAFNRGKSKFDDFDEIAQIIKLNFLFWSNAVVCVTAFDHCSWAIFSWRCTTSLLCLREDGGITLMCTEQAIFFVDWYTVNVMLWTVFVRKWPATGSLDSTLPMVYAKQKWFT